MILRRIFCAWVLISFLGTSLTLPSAHAQSATVDSTGLSFLLPKPGNRVDLSPAFEPILIKGLRVHPENPFIFDFIVDPGNEKLNADDLKKRSQRMVNYFLASLAVPEKDLWVNLSPVEKDRIIPDALNKTELGRDLLAEDYMLKQVTASLIYPESSFGKAFWNKVYDEAYQKYGVTQVPVNVFNKVWILPEKAAVFERGNTVYIIEAHLKVMLEEDYLARSRLGNRMIQGPSNVPVKDLSKQVLREIIVPAIEKEVNEGRNFTQLRQVFYSLILAQWYQDVFKKSILNKLYSGRQKIAGIDVSNPKNKDLIYHQYLSAYKKGVFNYIKQETDRLSQQAVPRKYFSGGFTDQPVKLTLLPISDGPAWRAMSSNDDIDLRVRLNVASPAQLTEPREVWNNLNRPLEMLKELQSLFSGGALNRNGFYAFIDKYSFQVANEKLYPVQGAWPVLKAITLLSRAEEEELLKALKEKYSNPDHPDPSRPELVDKIYLMNSYIDRDKWLQERALHLVGRRIYLAAAETHHWAGGLGPVMKFHGKGMKDLGADVEYIEPWYELRRDKGNPRGDPLDYEDPDVGLTELNKEFMEFDVKVGDARSEEVRNVHVKVATGLDENKIRVYMFKDVGTDGQSFYTRMLYNYGGENNPVTKEESMAFLSAASAELIKQLEIKRKLEQGDSWKPAVVHGNDGQYAPLQAVTMSRYGSEEVIKDIFWAFTTHTYRNRGNNNESKLESMHKKVDETIRIFLKHMMGIKNRYINAFRQMSYIDFTSAGVRLADMSNAVSDKHRDYVQDHDPNAELLSITNGAVPEEMASIYREEFQRLKNEGKIPPDADFERPTAQENALTKIECKKRLNRIIPLSKFSGIDFTNMPGLDPTNPKGIWEKVSDTEVRLKKEFEHMSPAYVRQLAGDGFKQIEKILYQYQGIRAANGTFLRVDLDKPLIGFARRLVDEKAGAERAFKDENVWKMVALGYNVVLMGNNQGTEESITLAMKFKKLEAKIAAQKLISKNSHWGSFQFVESFTPEQKKLFLSAADIQIQDSEHQTGAAEFSEEDITANGGLQGGATWREGVIVDQGIPLDFDHPGKGQTLIPKHDSAASWFDSVYFPVMQLWKRDADHHGFYQHAALSPRLNRIQRYLITSATYLREYENVFARKEQAARDDKMAQEKIVEPIGKDRGKMELILNNGHHDGPGFRFKIDGQPEYRADNNGLRSFLAKKKQLEEEYGYDIFLGQLFIKKEFETDLLLKLFDNNVSSDLLKAWFKNLYEQKGVSVLEKQERFNQFVQGLNEELQKRLQVTANNPPSESPAMLIPPGGIKLDNIPIERRGNVMTNVVNDKELEGMLLNAQGLYGVIIGITPISNLLDFIQ